MSTAVSEAPLVLDNGGCTLKVGFPQDAEPQVIPNCVAKAKGSRQWLTGDLLREARDVSCLVLKRPIDRGYVVNWELQQDIWQHTFEKVLRVDTRGRTLLLTEPPMNLSSCRAAAEEIIFEGLGFSGMHACIPAELALPHFTASNMTKPRPKQARTGLVLDCGFSFTHAIPLFDGKAIPSAVRRINIGGKAITNLLKEMVSYRSLNMMDETYLMEVVKNSVSFVSASPLADLQTAKQKNSPLRLEYVLPDGVHNLRGFVREPVPPVRGNQLEQTLLLANERFMPVEALFRPVDIGMQQAGPAETIVQAVTACPPQLAPLLYDNIMLTGGTASCPGFRERLEAELRPLVPLNCDVSISIATSPIEAAWHGGAKVASSAAFQKVVVTRAEYEEHGQAAAQRMMGT